MTISPVVQNGFLDDSGKQLIRIPPRAAETSRASARKRAKYAREKKKAGSKRSRLIWTVEEHERFLEGLEMFPAGPWRRIAEHVGTRSTRQAMTHAQKYRQKIERRKTKRALNENSSATSNSSTQSVSESQDAAAAAAAAAVTVVTRSAGLSDSQSTAEQEQKNKTSTPSTKHERDASLEIGCDEHALMREFLDSFEPLEMDCEQSLASLGSLPDHQAFLLGVGATSYATETQETNTPSTESPGQLSWGYDIHSPQAY